jgi:hypothetical protein
LQVSNRQCGAQVRFSANSSLQERHVQQYEARKLNKAQKLNARAPLSESLIGSDRIGCGRM